MKNGFESKTLFFGLLKFLLYCLGVVICAFVFKHVVDVPFKQAILASVILFLLFRSNTIWW